MRGEHVLSENVRDSRERPWLSTPTPHPQPHLLTPPVWGGVGVQKEQPVSLMSGEEGGAA